MDREIIFRAWIKKYNKFWNVVTINFATKEILAPDGEWYKYDELQQYTGLQDKNGTMVYEGDIVKRDLDDDLGIVTIDEGVVTMSGDCQLALFQEEFEIMGNKNDTPELLNNL